MWPFSTEVKISDTAGEHFFECIDGLLRRSFGATLDSQSDGEMELTRYDYQTQLGKIAIISEGMAGTSLVGSRKAIDAILNAAKEDSEIAKHLA